MNQAENLRNGMRVLRQMSPQIRASQVDMLLTIYQQPGINQKELAIECDVTTSTVSRAVDVFSDSGRRDGKGGALGICYTENCPDDDRLNRIFLTAKGQQIMKLLLDVSYGSAIS